MIFFEESGVDDLMLQHLKAFLALLLENLDNALGAYTRTTKKKSNLNISLLLALHYHHLSADLHHVHGHHK